eukprot:TRINITY_DN3205_c0_g1_i1.p1 TRINITY_DN3205_c0_g1~~TRINITY_DN3205_c0_g1_i1.p1  ORF type:complete len:272 (-),score=75.20 TRINITY_DN3205_c0_g1_i1:162-977(-)
MSEDSKENVWYLAIGSMMNPVSLRLRQLAPIRSMPAEVKGYRLMFFGVSGMASIEKAEGESLHGVLHLMTQEHMKILDEIELSYLRVNVTCTLYDGTEQEGTAYMVDPAKYDTTKPNNNPSERYIDILTQGARHYGVKAEYIEWLANHPCVPRKTPAEFRKFQPKEGLEMKNFTSQELSQYNGADGKDICLCVNGKVLRYIGSGQNPFVVNIRNLWAGKDCTFQGASYLYEPKYPVSSCLEEMPEEHRAFVEDMVYGMMSSEYEMVGYLVN